MITSSISSASAWPSLSPQTSTSPASAGVQAQSPADWLMNFAKMTPAQQMRATILAKMGLTEQDLANMDAKTRQKVEDKIKEEIKREVANNTEKKTGVIVDLKA